MFDSREYPKSLNEDIFEEWLEAGRESKMRYEYMLVVWDDLEADYHPEYVENRSSIKKYPLFGESSSHSAIVAVYDLYSEARITIQ
ncbi:MAG: hypothetical protein ACJAXX_000198 [Roseivirga sp.]|jgi:hypothetical protein